MLEEVIRMRKLILVVEEDSQLLLDLLKGISEMISNGCAAKGCLCIPNPDLYFGRKTDMMPDILVTNHQGVIESVSAKNPNIVVIPVRLSDPYATFKEVQDVLGPG